MTRCDRLTGVHSALIVSSIKDFLFLSDLRGRINTIPSPARGGTVQVVLGYFSPPWQECSVVIEEHRLVLERSFWWDIHLYSDHLSFRKVSGIRAPMESVAIFDSPGKGRGLKANKEFWAGDVIFSEASIAAVVFDR